MPRLRRAAESPLAVAGWVAVPAIGGVAVLIGAQAVAVALVAAIVVLGGVALVELVRGRERSQESRRGVLFVWCGLLVVSESAVARAFDEPGGPFPSTLGILATAGVGLVGLGLFLLLQQQRRDHCLGVLFEAILCVATLGFIPWALWAGASGPGDAALRSLPAMVAAVALWLGIRLVGDAEDRAHTADLAVSALFWMVVVDVVVASGVAAAVTEAQRSLEVVRLAAGCALAVAAVNFVRRLPVDRTATLPSQLGPGKVAAPLGLTLLAPALFALQAIQGDPPGLSVVLTGSSVMAFLVAVYLVRQVQESARAELRANHDALTGLPNRAMFHDRLEVALAHARREHARVGVMFLDLDRFKSINDSLGHGVGNQLLQRVAERLAQSVREGDTVARMGGDEFMVLLPSVDTGHDCVTVAEKLLHTMAEPFVLGSRELVTSASIGIAIFPDNGRDGETLAKNADIAMYRAKASGRNAFQLYTPDLSVRAQVKHSLESGLRSALENGALELHYQPKIDAVTRQIVGLEALARWPHAEFGFVPPTAFIPLAEETGLIVPLGEWVLETACAQINQWADATGARIPVAINLSAREFTHKPIDARIADALDRHGLAAGLLELEITESIFMHDLFAASEALFNLRNMGVRCSIDDFGTGYSGLTYLSQLPIYSLKIDQSFIRRIGSSRSGDRIVDAVITLARSLDMRVIAEGVETDGQATFLVSRGCDEMQGRLFCPPLSAVDVEELLRGDRDPPGPLGEPADAHAAPAPPRDARAEPVAVGARVGAPVVDVPGVLEALCTNQSLGESDEPGILAILRALGGPERVLATRTRKGVSLRLVTRV
jgi:diguanylate cyclase (GGDEF)-like protein